MKRTACLIVASLITCPALSLPVFTDPSFENAGSLTMVNNTRYRESGNNNNAVSTLATDLWHIKNINQGQEGFLLENTTSYKGAGPVPNGVTGSQFITGSRSESNTRGIFQYVSDGASTTGEITVSIDYWAHELNSADSPSGNGSFSFEVIAFNDPATVFVDLGAGDQFNVVNGSGFISSGDAYSTYNAVDAATGFQTIEVTLDLGAGYQYIGVAVGVSDFTPYGSTNGETVSFDNLVVTPEPSSLALLGFAGLLVNRRRR